MARRLDAWLGANGFGTRKETRKIIRSGRVMVNGTTTKLVAASVQDNDEVSVDDKIVTPLPTVVYLLCHKPAGLSCSHDEREAPLLDDIIPKTWDHLAVEPAGRLDRDTTGLLLLTSDGNTIHQLVHPKRKVSKRYHVVYRGNLVANAVERCLSGIELENDPKPCLPATLVITKAASDKHNGEAYLTLHEGRYHQVKRMFAALGGQVVALHRDRIGKLDLPEDLIPGEMREASDAELTALLTRDTE